MAASRVHAACKAHRWPGKAGSAAVAWLALVLACVGVSAFAADDDAAQGRRIERERSEVAARARVGEAACAERFAVSACLAQVRAERRAALQQLDAQRALLDDAQRKRRAADRQARIQERQDAQAKADESRLPPAPAAQPKAAARQALAPPADEAGGATGSDARRRNPTATAKQRADAARRAAASKRRVDEATAHRAAVEQKNRDRDAKRAPAKDLPVPVAPAASAALR